ncbi:MAG: hypothetical protein DRJ42_26185 [Deltaproteobacteria bacterium]|nr:MAG: hypothetical protein DRJ42_26185 [Deltaproteobacteria bacterium]
MPRSCPPAFLLPSAACVAVLVFSGCSRGADGGDFDPSFPDAATSDAGVSPPPRHAPPSGCDPRDPDAFGECTADAGGPDDSGRPDDTEDAAVVDTSVPPVPADCPWDDAACATRCLVAARTADPCAGLPTIAPGTILDDTVWDGSYCVEGTVGVLSGVTLTIEAGSELYFRPGATLSTEGLIEARGTAAAPILFSGAGLDPYAGIWGGLDVRLTPGGQVDLHHVTIEWAEYGVGQWEEYSHPTFAGPETNALLEQVTLRFNQTGIILDDNTHISDSLVMCNVIGINVAAEDPDPGPAITNNNLCDNRLYDVSAGQDGADVRGNYWCTTDMGVIEARTYDERDSLSAGGLLDFSPILTGPAPGAPALP